jgi:hypothetical protein
MNAMGRLWHPLPIDVPLRVNSRRFWLWGLVAGLGSTAVIANSPNILYVDFPQFWAAGRTAGTPDLLDPARHHAWQVAHGVPPDFFPYTPGAAWLWWPFGHFSLGDGFWLHALAMTALVFAGGWLGARVYGLDVRVGLICAFAWAPSMASVAFGQNGPLGLVFALLAIEGLRRDDERLTGLGVGLLLYKPTLALPLLGLLLLRRRWLGLVVAAGVSCGWYLMSVAAAAGDWTWPVAMVNGLGEWFRACMAYNPAKSTSIPGVLIGYGVPWPVAWAVAAAVVLAALPRLLRASLVEAAAGACLVGLVVSPHSLNYEATLMLPIVLWSLGGRGAGIAEPWRTRLVVVCCVAGLLHLFSTYLGLSSVGVAAVAVAAIWISGCQREETTAEPADGAARRAAAPAQAALPSGR